MIRYALYLTPEQLEYLRQKSKGGSSVSEIIRTAINKEIAEDKKQNVSTSLSGRYKHIGAELT